METGVVKSMAGNLAPKLGSGDQKSFPITFPVQSVGASPHQAKFFMGEVAETNKVVILKIESPIPGLTIVTPQYNIRYTYTMLVRFEGDNNHDILCRARLLSARSPV